MTRPDPSPPEIVALARERAAARAAADWPRADALRAEIEAAGWKVVDGGTAFRLEPAAPPTIEDGAIVRYGAAASVPSVLDVAPTARFTVELVADDWPDDLSRMLASLRAHAPTGTQVVIVANAPSSDQVARLSPGEPDIALVAGAAPEIVWTSTRLGHAAARNVGLRRATGAIVVLADTSIEPTGDALSPLETALADPGIAVAGGFGLVSADLRRFQDAAGPEVDAIELYWLAFRRDDHVALGPLDEKFTFYRNLDIWWSLVLRAGAGDDTAPRAARRLDLPLARHVHRGWASLPDDRRDRLSKRNFYRVLDRFRDRPDLLSGAPARPSTAGPLEA
ncbi:MAG TPA: glycosyltransferase [Candidatus Nanopelagicales bacterium]|nr:glycosyltransferase [Candidatus Nanopelagicales bacterium]